MGDISPSRPSAMTAVDNGQQFMLDARSPFVPSRSSVVMQHRILSHPSTQVYSPLHVSVENSAATH
ncbi:hypothetical protein AB6A40_002781 [Gnathostoma spinigerum]|uniref:Uncharacterized protein n=1 Tax=Gnathostoma spinigerum TaxID=75299 RepID=A0ABD6EHN1_9BILA